VIRRRALPPPSTRLGEPDPVGVLEADEETQKYESREREVNLDRDVGTEQPQQRPELRQVATDSDAANLTPAP